jgi:hypothetical protein
MTRVPPAVSVASVLALVVVACAASSTSGRIPKRFHVYDNTQYLNVDLASLGIRRSGIVEETPAQAQQIAAGQLPDRSAFQRAVTRVAGVPGPVVLDYEDLYLTGSGATATKHLSMLTTLARWARSAAPGKVIGFYGLIEHTRAAYIPLARRLAPLEGAFFPSMYTFSRERTVWLRKLVNVVELARRIAPHKPVYAYIWPQFSGRTMAPRRFIDASLWAFELAVARQYADGVVIWSKRTVNTSQGWLGATRSFMASAGGL